VHDERVLAVWGGFSGKGGCDLANDCGQLHPLLRGYLEDGLSARDRRKVARHLNLCAAARGELDRLRGGGLQAPEVPANPASEPWDLKILHWLFKAPPPVRKPEPAPKKNKAAREPGEGPPPGGEPHSSPLKPILGVFVFFLALAFLTHFVQNAADNPWVKSGKRWLSSRGYHVFGVTSSLEMVLDLSGQPRWGGTGAPVAFPYHQVLSDPDLFRLYWRLLEPSLPPPALDFTKNEAVVLFMGQEPGGGYSADFKRMEEYTDKTLVWYDESSPSGAAAGPPTRPWVLQVIPKPPRQPVLVQKIR
jgi:hypothetical protein